jgi:hypothetical protein
MITFLVSLSKLYISVALDIIPGFKNPFAIRSVNKRLFFRVQICSIVKCTVVMREVELSLKGV